MTRYDSIKFLKDTKARKMWECAQCGRTIEIGEIYFKESTGLINAPHLVLRAFCAMCYHVHGEALITVR